MAWGPPVCSGNLRAPLLLSFDLPVGVRGRASFPTTKHPPKEVPWEHRAAARRADRRRGQRGEVAAPRAAQPDEEASANSTSVSGSRMLCCPGFETHPLLTLLSLVIRSVKFQELEPFLNPGPMLQFPGEFWTTRCQGLDPRGCDLVGVKGVRARALFQTLPQRRARPRVC